MEDIKHIGVAPFEVAQYVDTHLKRYALFFEHIKLVTASNLSFVLTNTPTPQNYDWSATLPWFPTLEFLQQKGYLQCSPSSRMDNLEWSALEDFLKKLDIDTSQWSYLRGLIALGRLELVRLRTLGEVEAWVKRNSQEENKASELFSSWATRLETLHMRQFEQCDAVCVGDNLLELRHEQKSVDQVVSRDSLYQIIINGLPVLNDRVPWEDILLFREETTSKQQQRALRLWIAEMITGKLSLPEAADKIESLKDDYRAHMKSAGIKMGTATIKTYVVATAELLESALKLKLKTLVELPFKLIEAKTELMEAERKAPGRQLAYVVRAEDTFA